MSLVFSGGKKPISKAMLAKNQKARRSIASSEVRDVQMDRRKDQNVRTLYVRFETEQLPSSEEEIRAIHPDIHQIRILRQARKAKNLIRYCFIEFKDESTCEIAKRALAQKAFRGGQLYVDFMGEKSKRGGNKYSRMSINPTRLIISGMDSGITQMKLKKLFPKAKETFIPARSQRKGNTFAFAQFANPADAKEAFDKSKSMSIDGNQITVLFAKMNQKPKPEGQEAFSKKASPKKSKQGKLQENKSKQASKKGQMIKETSTKDENKVKENKVTRDEVKDFINLEQNDSEDEEMENDVSEAENDQDSDNDASMDDDDDNDDGNDKDAVANPEDNGSESEEMENDVSEEEDSENNKEDDKMDDSESEVENDNSDEDVQEADNEDNSESDADDQDEVESDAESGDGKVGSDESA